MWPTLLPLIGNLIEKVFPDPEKANEAKLKLMEMQMNNDQFFAKLEADTTNKQLDINAVEAQNSNLFVSGGRPFIIWVCGAAFALQYVVGPLIFYVVQLYHGQWQDPFPTFDMSTLLPALFGLLGLGGMRTYEKVKRVTK